jgi:hypothetical protein
MAIVVMVEPLAPSTSNTGGGVEEPPPNQIEPDGDGDGVTGLTASGPSVTVAAIVIDVALPGSVSGSWCVAENGMTYAWSPAL